MNLLSQKPIYLSKVTNIKLKIKNFQEMLIKKGIIKIFDGQLYHWNYPKINESARVSKIINSLL